MPKWIKLAFGSYHREQLTVQQLTVTTENSYFVQEQPAERNTPRVVKPVSLELARSLLSVKSIVEIYRKLLVLSSYATISHRSSC